VHCEPEEGTAMSYTELMLYQFQIIWIYLKINKQYFLVNRSFYNALRHIC
jgi:hypothetical protein